MKHFQFLSEIEIKLTSDKNNGLRSSHQMNERNLKSFFWDRHRSEIIKNIEKT